MSTHTLPVRTPAQRMTALELANETRYFRADLKKEIAKGADWRTHITNPEPRLHSMKVYDLLLAIPKAGDKKVRLMLARAAVADTKTLGGLSERQREALVADSPRIGRVRDMVAREREAAKKAELRAIKRDEKAAEAYRLECLELRRQVRDLEKELDAMYRAAELRSVAA